MKKKQFKGIPQKTFLKHFFKTTIESEINLLKEYIIDNRNGIQKHLDAFEVMVEEQIEKNPDNGDFIAEWYAEQHHQYKRFYPTFFNNSTLLSLYSFFEYYLKKICERLHKLEGCAVKPNDLAGQNYIVKSRKYLCLVVGLDLSSLNNDWEKITEYQHLRNIIAHNNSNIFKIKDIEIKKQPHYSLFKQNKHLCLDSVRGTITIKNDEYLLEFCNLIEHYLISIIKKY